LENYVKRRNPGGRGGKKFRLSKNKISVRRGPIGDKRRIHKYGGRGEEEEAGGERKSREVPGARAFSVPSVHKGKRRERLYSSNAQEG